MKRLCWPLLATLLSAAPSLAQDGGTDAGVDAGTSSEDAGAGPEDAGTSSEDAGAGPEDAGTSSEDAGAAPEDAGVDDDAGPDPDPDPEPEPEPDPDCDITCEGDVLRFCDAVTGELLEVDCAAELEARCGLLNEEWGDDCLLPLGAECSSGYAEGASRCDPAGPYYCRNGACTDDPNEEEELPELPGGAGGIGDTTGEDPHPLACLGCNDSNLPLPFSFSALFVALGGRLVLRRRRLRRLEADPRGR